MRRKIALTIAGAAVAAAVLPLQPASAVCVADLSDVGGPSCYNPCNTVAGAINTADRALGDHLDEATCPQ